MTYTLTVYRRRFWDVADGDYDYSACPACGQPSDYCQGHGDIGDPRGAAILAAHDDGRHDDCDARGCDDAAQSVETVTGTAVDIVDYLRWEGFSFDATGADWAALPDGSRIVDYSTGEREDVSAHLSDDVPDDVRADIMAAVDDVGTVATMGGPSELAPMTYAVRTDGRPGWRIATRRAVALVADVAPMSLKRVGPDLYYAGRSYALTFYRRA